MNEICQVETVWTIAALDTTARVSDISDRRVKKTQWEAGIGTGLFQHKSRDTTKLGYEPTKFAFEVFPDLWDPKG